MTTYKYDPWPCPFCLVTAVNEEQLTLHIGGVHPHDLYTAQPCDALIEACDALYDLSTELQAMISRLEDWQDDC